VASSYSFLDDVYFRKHHHQLYNKQQVILGSVIDIIRLQIMHMLVCVDNLAKKEGASKQVSWFLI
jgi:hypothetical protein